MSTERLEPSSLPTPTDNPVVIPRTATPAATKPLKLVLPIDQTIVPKPSEASRLRLPIVTLISLSLHAIVLGALALV
ncbi:MAG: hypothetical protein WCH39_27665, partial [Schlesneria sp.]